MPRDDGTHAVAQQDMADAAAERRAEHLIDQGALAALDVLDGEDAAIRQNADFYAGRIGEAVKVQLLLGW